MSVIWFDWGIDFCACQSKQSVASIMIERRFENTKTFEWNGFVFKHVWLWKTRRCFVCLFISLFGKIQVNIYLLSSLILHCISVTRSRQSEGRSLNTSSTHYRLSTAKEGLLIEKEYFQSGSIRTTDRWKTIVTWDREEEEKSVLMINPMTSIVFYEYLLNWHLAIGEYGKRPLMITFDRDVLEQIFDNLTWKESLGKYHR